MRVTKRGPFHSKKERQSERNSVVVTKNASLVVFAASKYSRKALSVGAKMVNEPPDRASESPATSMASARVCAD